MFLSLQLFLVMFVYQNPTTLTHEKVENPTTSVITKPKTQQYCKLFHIFLSCKTCNFPLLKIVACYGDDFKIPPTCVCVWGHWRRGRLSSRWWNSGCWPQSTWSMEKCFVNVNVLTQTYWLGTLRKLSLNSLLQLTVSCIFISLLTLQSSSGTRAAGHPWQSEFLGCPLSLF